MGDLLPRDDAALRQQVGGAHGGQDVTRCVDKVVAPCIADEPESGAEVVCGEHVADELIVNLNSE